MRTHHAARHSRYAQLSASGAGGRIGRQVCGSSAPSLYVPATVLG